jgi:hypothetical protein
MRPRIRMNCMSSEWLKVMLEEIARKKAEDEQTRAEERRRSEAEDGKGESSSRENRPRG